MALTNLERIPMGRITLLTGTYTHTAGVAEESTTVDGDVIGASIMVNDANGPFDVTGTGMISISTSGYVSTITFRGVAGITTARFMVWFKN